MNPHFTITNAMIRGLAQIERARGFLEAAHLSEAWIPRMSERALLLEAHHTTHIEGTKLTLDQAEQLLAGEAVPQADADDVQELLNQGVRDAGMDLTGWLDYFVTGLATQLEEVKERGRLAIEVDILIQEHNLNERQAAVLRYLQQHDTMSIQVYQQLIPGANRRTLQCDLKIMVEKGIVATEGATHQLLYRFR